MGRKPKVEAKKKKGGWSEEEDQKLVEFMNNNGGLVDGINWETLSQKAGLNRCGKSCRLRWKNYLNPHITRGNFSKQEESIIIQLHSRLGNKWSQIAAKLPGRTDNDIKNFWNTKLRKKLVQKPTPDQYSSSVVHHIINPPTNYIISFFTDVLLGFLNMQEWEWKQHHEMVLASSPLNHPFLPDINTIPILQPEPGNHDLDNGNSTIPFGVHTNLISDSWSEEGVLSANLFDSNNDLAQYNMLPPLASATTDDIEIPMPTSDEFHVNPNSVASFDYGWIANDIDYQFPDPGSAMHDNEILSSCLGHSPSYLSSNTYAGSSCSFYDDFQS